MAETNDPKSQDPQWEAIERLNEQNRIQLEARMLPKTRPLTDGEIGSVRTKLQAYMETHCLRAAQVSREVGYSPGTLSQWTRNNYGGDNERLAHAINDWIEVDARRRLAKRPEGYVTTWVAETMRSIIHLADKRCMMAAIVAPSGSGKTKVLQILAEELRGLYVCCQKPMTWRTFLQVLAKELGYRGGRKNAAELLEYIIAELKGTRRTILVDEAQMLGRGISSIRSIHDLANVAIVMAGAAEILGLIDDRSDGRGQFSRRCIQMNLLKEIRGANTPEGEGGRLLFTLDEIRSFFRQRNIKLTRDALDLLWRLACLPNHGSLGLVEEIGKIAAEMAEANGDRPEDQQDVVTRDDVVYALHLFDNASDVYMIRLAERLRTDEPTKTLAKTA